MGKTLTYPTPASAGRVDFNAFYSMTLNQVNTFLDRIQTVFSTEGFQFLFSNPMDSIGSLRVYPFFTTDHSDDTVLALEDVVIGGVTVLAKGIPLNATVPNIKHHAIFRFDGANRGFLNFEPYTKIEVYAPYVGFITLDPSYVINKYTFLDYVVDYITGKCSLYVSTAAEADAVDSEKDILLVRESNIGADIQIGARTGVEVARNLLKLSAETFGTVASGVATGGTDTALKAAAFSTSLATSTGINVITASQISVRKGGASQPSLNSYGPNEAFAIITRQNTVEPDSYASEYGRPCGKTLTLGDLTGYTVVDAVHMTGFEDATSDEVTEIERLLKSGVIF